MAPSIFVGVGEFPLFVVAPVAFVVAVAGGFIGVGRLCGVRPERGDRQLMQDLAQPDNVKAVGALIDRLRAPNVRTRTDLLVEQALIRLLPRLTERDGDLLASDQKGLLACHLERIARVRQDGRLQMVILEALAKVGDERSV